MRRAGPSRNDRKRRPIPGLIAGMALCLSGGVATADPPSRPDVGNWRSFVSEAGRFRVELPEDPIVEPDRDRFTPLGPVSGEKYSVRSRDLELAVEVRDLPTLARVFVPTDTVLESTRESVAADLDAVEVRGRAITVQGLPARDFLYRIPGTPPIFERAIAVLVEGRLYLLTGQAGVDTAASPELERFFGSFQFWNER